MFGGVEVKIIRRYFKVPFECNLWMVIFKQPVSFSSL